MNDSGRTALWRARWRELGARERYLIGCAVLLVLLALLWQAVLGPVLAALRGGQQHWMLDAQLAQMQALQAQAQMLKQQPRQSAADVQRSVEQVVREQLGVGARVVPQGERLSITVANAAPEALAQLLTQLRQNAKALPREVRLTRNANAQWDGVITLSLPPS